MASIKKKSSGGGGANWMDTYGDMVTLLLCFFVLLYSISTVDQQKWMIVVRSFNKDAVLSPVGPVGSSTSSGGDDKPATDQVEQDLEELYEFLAAFAASHEEAGDILVSQGDGYVFISFSDAVFFDGDSTVLRADGKRMLDGILPALRECAPSIDQLKVLGHTAQVKADEPNPAPGDRWIAAGRAANVAAYIQENIPSDRLHPARIVDEGHGQWLNVAPHDGKEENRVKNRRVEIIVTGKDLENRLSDSVEQYRTMYQTTQGLKTTG